MLVLVENRVIAVGMRWSAQRYKIKRSASWQLAVAERQQCFRASFERGGTLGLLAAPQCFPVLDREFPPEIDGMFM